MNTRLIIREPRAGPPTLATRAPARSRRSGHPAAKAERREPKKNRKTRNERRNRSTRVTRVTRFTRVTRLTRVTRGGADAANGTGAAEGGDRITGLRVTRSDHAADALQAAERRAQGGRQGGPRGAAGGLRRPRRPAHRRGRGRLPDHDAPGVSRVGAP